MQLCEKYYIDITFLKITMYNILIRVFKNIRYTHLCVRYLSVMLKHMLVIALAVDNSSKKSMKAKYEIYFCNVAYKK